MHIDDTDLESSDVQQFNQENVSPAGRLLLSPRYYNIRISVHCSTLADKETTVGGGLACAAFGGVPERIKERIV